MAKHGFLSVLFLTMLALGLGLFMSSYKDPNAAHAGFPWQIERLENAQTRVFSLTLGQSTLAQAEQQFKEMAELTLFSRDGEGRSVEAFFGEIKIAGLKSKMVMAFEIDEEILAQMQNRGTRISTLGSGTRKITLSAEDARQVRQSAIHAITYLPSIHLTEALIEKRFGQPAEKRQDPKSDAVHWLYPDVGVDIAISEKNKEVIQYVLPQHFSRLVEPLKDAHKVL